MLRCSADVSQAQASSSLAISSTNNRDESDIEKLELNGVPAGDASNDGWEMDPANPMNWAALRKWTTVTLIALLSMVA